MIFFCSFKPLARHGFPFIYSIACFVPVAAKYQQTEELLNYEATMATAFEEPHYFYVVVLITYNTDMRKLYSLQFLTKKCFAEIAVQLLL